MNIELSYILHSTRLSKAIVLQLLTNNEMNLLFLRFLSNQTVHKKASNYSNFTLNLYRCDHSSSTIFQIRIEKTQRKREKTNLFISWSVSDSREGHHHVRFRENSSLMYWMINGLNVTIGSENPIRFDYEMESIAFLCQPDPIVC